MPEPTIGERLRKRRVKLGFSQKQLAQRAQRDKQTIWRIEHGIISNPGADTLAVLAKALKVPLDYFVNS